MKYFGMKDSGLNPNSTLFYAIGIYGVIFTAASYVIPELGASEFQGVLQHILRPLFLTSAVSGAIVGVSISYLSTGKESGYMVGGFLVWLILTAGISGAYIYTTNGFEKSIPAEDRAKDRQQIISGSFEQTVDGWTGLYEETEEGYLGFCESLPGLVQGSTPQISASVKTFQEEVWGTFNCAADDDAYAFSFGDGFDVTDWRWCKDANGFSGEGNINNNTIRCTK